MGQYETVLSLLLLQGLVQTEHEQRRKLSAQLDPDRYPHQLFSLRLLFSIFCHCPIIFLALARAGLSLASPLLCSLHVHNSRTAHWPRGWHTGGAPCTTIQI